MDVSRRRNKYESRLLIRPTYCFLVILLIPRDAYAAYPTVLWCDTYSDTTTYVLFCPADSNILRGIRPRRKSYRKSRRAPDTTYYY